MDQQTINDAGHKAYLPLFARAEQRSIHIIICFLTINILHQPIISYRKSRVNNEILASNGHVHRQASHSCCNILIPNSQRPNLPKINSDRFSLGKTYIYFGQFF